MTQTYDTPPTSPQTETSPAEPDAEITEAHEVPQPFAKVLRRVEDVPVKVPFQRGEIPDHPEGEPQHPDIQRAVMSTQAIAQSFYEDITCRDALEILRTALQTDREGEAVLFTQAQVLDGLFHRVMIKALTAIDHEDSAQNDLKNDRRLTMALRAQNQCRNTLNAMNAIRESMTSKFDKGKFF